MRQVAFPKAAAVTCTGLLSLSISLGWEGPSGETEAQGATRVGLAEGVAPPGWEVRVPVSLMPAKGTEVGRLGLKISYPSKPLVYLRVEKAPPLEAAGSEVVVERPGPTTEEGKTALQLEVSGPKGEGKALPEGVLLYIILKVAENTPPGDLPVAIEEVRAESQSTPGQKLEAVAGKATSIKVLPSTLPKLTCFFFLH